MPGPFGGRRRRIRAAYDALYEAIATADGAAAAAAEAARHDHLLALVELWLREKGLDGAAADPELRGLLTNPTFTDVVRAVERDRVAGAKRPAQALPELDAIVAAAAPGSAGEPPENWLGKLSDHTGVHGVPRLWRVGVGRLGASGEPVDVAVPLLDESHLQISTHPDGRATALALVENLLVRVVGHFRPGLVDVHVWDVQQITGPLPRLHGLTRTGILTVHDPRGLAPLLEDLSDRVRRVHRRVLGVGMPSLAAWVDDLGREERPERPEPWTVAVLVGDRSSLRPEEQAALARIARGGLACGVQLVLLDVPITLGAAVETIHIDRHLSARTSMTGPYGQVEIERRFDADAVTRACERIADEHENWRSRITTLEDLLTPAGVWKSSQDGLKVQIGFDNAERVELVLDDASPHALIGGPSGSGKTNLLLAWIAALCMRYSPDELELYLLDFKEGVSFAQFAPRSGDDTYLPHAKLLGLHVNTDREFGLALLQYLSDEMRRRAAVAKQAGVPKLADLREVDREGRWPRIVAVIDEFQYLFGERDAVTRAATLLLEDVARRGRSQGIHLVLASQDVSGIEAFWGRRGIFEQFVLRIGLPRARGVLDERNEATLELPRWHAVVNHESGMRHANRVARIPNASSRNVLDTVRHELHAAFAGAAVPHVFDGSRAPAVGDLLDRLAGPRVALVGQAIDVGASPATATMPDAPGRNLAVLGAGAPDAVRVLGAAAAGFVRTSTVPVEVVLAPLVDEAVEPARRLVARLARPERTGDGPTASEQPVVSAADVPVVGLAELRERVVALADEVKARLTHPSGPAKVVVLYAADAADAVLDRAGTEALRTLVHFGPETGVHVLGWWRTVPRLKALLVTGAVVDDIGAWVALDVQGAELQPLLPGTLFTWSPRPGRGLFFDRAQHAAPRVIVVPGEDE